MWIPAPRSHVLTGASAAVQGTTTPAPVLPATLGLAAGPTSTNARSRIGAWMEGSATTNLAHTAAYASRASLDPTVRAFTSPARHRPALTEAPAGQPVMTWPTNATACQVCNCNWNTLLYVLFHSVRSGQTCTWIYWPAPHPTETIPKNIYISKATSLPNTVLSLNMKMLLCIYPHSMHETPEY